MNSQKPEKLSDMFDRDLAGWLITRCHCLELSHKLMGFFPAITVNEEEIVIVLDKSILQKVWDRLPRKRARVTTFTAIANPIMGIAFCLEGYDYTKDTGNPLRVLTSEALDVLCQQEKPFQWAPGLLCDIGSHIPDPIFT